MASKTKAELLKQHQANADLNLPLPPQMMRRDQDLSADDLRMPLDERIIAAASEAMEAGETHYVDVPGIAPLRQALAEDLNRRAGGAYRADHIIVTAGLQESRFLTLQKIGERYANIGLPAVAHPGVRKALGVRERNIVPLPVDEARGYLPAVERIAAAAAEGCRLFYLESPSRLTGAAYSADEVAAIAQVLGDNDASAIWDQGLSLWVDGGCSSLVAHEDAPARVATIGECFPGQGLASWFIAYIAAPQDWLPAMQSQKQIMAICTATASQYAALEAGKHFDEAHKRQLAGRSRQRAESLELARECGLEAIAGAAASIIALRTADGAAAALAQLRNAGYDCAAGSDFGAPDVIRLSVNGSTRAALSALC